METTYTRDGINDNTTGMTLRNRGNPSGFSKLFAPFMKMMMKKADQKDLDLLKNTRTMTDWKIVGDYICIRKDEKWKEHSQI